MAITFGNITTVSGGSTTSFNMTKPSGVVAGDLLFIMATARANTSISAPSGWTEVFDSAVSSSYTTALYWKIATSTEVSAANFQIDFANSGEYRGTCWYYTGQTFVTPSFTTVQTRTSGTSISSTGLTPPGPNSTLVIATAFSRPSDATAVSVSNYAVATSNPSWTERQDVYDTNSSQRMGHAVADAVRPETTATGNYSFDYSSSVGRAWDILIAIQEIINVTVSADTVLLTSSLPTPSISGAANTTASALTATFNILNPTVETQTVSWDYEQRPNDSVWVFEDQI